MHNFDSVAALIAHVEQGGRTLRRPANVAKFERYCNPNGSKARGSNADDAMSWYGVSSAAECFRAIREGWPEGAAEIQRIREALDVAPPRDLRRRRVRSDQGDAFDLHRAWAGQFDRAWDRTRRESAQTVRHVTLVASMQGLGNMPAWAYFARGASVLAVADVLGESGYDVAIVAEYRLMGYLEGQKRSMYSLRVPIKEFLQPADVASLAAVTALAGFKRIYGFGAAYIDADRIDRDIFSSTGTSQCVIARNRGEFAGFDCWDDTSGGSRVDQGVTLARITAQRVIRAIEDGNSDGATVWPHDDHGLMSTEYKLLPHEGGWKGGKAKKGREARAA